MDLKSFQMGLGLGLMGKPLPLAKKEPVAYLYNGVQLPGLPEWDREAYPYAVIVYLEPSNADPYYILFLNAEVPQWTFSLPTTYRVTLPGNTARSLVENNAWGTPAAVEQEYCNVKNASHVIWANTDIGSILSASEPIPIYE